ncbi:class I SAM-dependent methyltransferase [Kitasatospora purpeofusca]|uniref:hypothetical protein n=1 Tax=Kitasatospora purpeofusca TaxID=67352 RepID=UPI0036AAC9ED
MDDARRTVHLTADGRMTYETGVSGHGPTGAVLADLVAEEIRTWNADYHDRIPHIELPDTPAVPDRAAGRFVLDRPNHPITIIWE